MDCSWNDAASRPHQRHQKTWRVRLVPWIVGVIQILVSLGHWLNNIPLNRLFELNLCRAHYLEHDPSFVDPDGNVEERFCKLDVIQERLAFYLGLISTLELVCELIATIPMGYASDKFGRKIVMFANSITAILAIIWYICVVHMVVYCAIPYHNSMVLIRITRTCGAICASTLSAGTYLSFFWLIAIAHFYHTFPIQAIVAGPFLFLFTGFYNVLGANMNALISDTTDTHAQRTTIFSWTMCGSQVTSLLAPAISATALARSLWLPFGLGTGCLALIIPCVLILPETRRFGVNDPAYKSSAAVNNGEQSETDAAESSPLLSNSSGSSEADDGETRNTERFQLQQYARTRLSRARQALHDMKVLTKSNPSFTFCLLIFLVTTLSKQSINILLQYTSKRYGVSFAEAGYIFTVKATTSLALYALVIPGSLHLLIKNLGFTSTHANLIGLKTSIIVFFAGTLLISFSTKLWMLAISLAVYTLGYALGVFALSYITDVTVKVFGESYVARTYSVVSLLETVGHLIGIPILTAAWVEGIRIGGWGLALPWWVSALFYMVIYIPAHYLKV